MASLWSHFGSTLFSGQAEKVVGSDASDLLPQYKKCSQREEKSQEHITLINSAE